MRGDFASVKYSGFGSVYHGALVRLFWSQTVLGGSMEPQCRLWVHYITCTDYRCHVYVVHLIMGCWAFFCSLLFFARNNLHSSCPCGGVSDQLRRA